MYHLWNGSNPFPKCAEMNILSESKYVNIHTAIEGEYQFLLGSAIIKHNDVFRSSWGNSFRMENDNNTILAEKISSDGGETWTEYKKLSQTDTGFGRSHGVYFEHMGKLYAFCPKAEFDRVDAYPELKMEAYVFNNGTWDNLGIVLDADFWPMCQPILLDNGTLVMAGLKTDDARAAVALCNGANLTQWEMKVLPNRNQYKHWGETTILKQADKLIAIVRAELGINCVLVSESYDNGKTWSDLEKSNFPIALSKMYAGVLDDGTNYLIFNPMGEGADINARDALCIAVGKDLFERVYIIRHGFETKPRFWGNNEWCYPYAYEDRETGKLYVVYAKNKEDCELAIIPTHVLFE
ncbi:MAG: exo-alpha-sialidase [Clostridia bacterium]|nr:exo-alpha-sialidase [Clostridia bacterium]